MKHLIILAVAGFLCLPTSAVFAQDLASSKTTGLKIGAKAPAFTLKDQTGKERSLDDLANNTEYIALIFYRSASW